MKKIVLIANWKMHHSQLSAQQYFTDFFSALEGISWEEAVQVGFAVPYTLLGLVRQTLQNKPARVLAQNVHHLDQGAFTGEISLAMLADLGIRATLIGHSERRQYFAENLETVNLKTKAALRAGFSPVLCIGESLSERQESKTKEVIERQLRSALNDISDHSNLIIAYEPIWAIGTGLAASPHQAQEVHQQIRALLASNYGTMHASRISLLYGGSVTPANLSSFLAQPDIDGALVGGASLQGESFAAMVKVARKSRKEQLS